jgi:enoyl-CoA hydratase/carnithine racemase
LTASTILFDVDQHVAVITFNRPEVHNAFDNDMQAAFADALADAAARSDVRCILLRGEGPSFCSGRDTKALGVRAADDSHFGHLGRSLRRKLAMLDIDKPVLAALKGHVIGGGLEIALKADIRIASNDARMSLPEIDWGIMTDSGGSVITAALAGPSRAKYLIMSGDVIDAAQAEAWGLVDFLVPTADLDTRALSVARRIAAKPPVALALAKQLVDGMFGDAIRRGLRNEMVALTALYATEDYGEARAARREARAANFTGR